MAKIVVAGRLHAVGMAEFEARSDIETVVVETPEDLAREIVDADAITVRSARLDRPQIASAGRLKVVSRHGVGYDQIDVDALNDHGIPLTVIGDANARPVAEHTMGLMLALAKDYAAYDRAVKGNDYGFRETLRAFDLAGKTVLIVGFGRIGTRVAKRCEAFEMDILIADPNVPERVVRGQGYRWLADFRDGLAEADIVTLHLPGNFDGSPVMGGQEFQRMKPGSVFVNCARGTLIDEDALYRALTDGPLQAAGLDVTRVEPPADDHPLKRLDNVILTPHVAASSREGMAAMSAATARNALAAVDGTLDPYFVVNQEVLGRG